MDTSIRIVTAASEHTHPQTLSKLSATNLLGGPIPPIVLHWKFVDKRAIDLRANSGLELPQNIGVLADAVEEIDLSSLNLTGPLPSSLSELLNLKKLDLSNNQLAGDIDFDCFELLCRLEFFDLRKNPALNQQTIAGQLGCRLTNLSNVEKINLTNKKLTGEIPPAISALGKLTHLDLSENQLEGEVDQQIFELICRLEFCNLHRCGLNPKTVAGQLGCGFTKLSEETELDISSKKLKGSIPPGFPLLKKLKKLDLSNNQLEGEIDEDFFLFLCRLQRFDLSNNPLLDQSTVMGWMANNLQNINSQQALELNDKLLIGTIPPLPGIFNLKTLDLSQNQLTGELPETLTKLGSLKKLCVSDNCLTGQIPGKLSEMRGLAELDLARNSFEGPIPAKLASLVGLTELNLSGNQLDGPIIPPKLPKLVRLRVLHLSHNRLGGEIPKSLSRLKNLRELSLSPQDSRTPLTIDSSEVFPAAVPKDREGNLNYWEREKTQLFIGFLAKLAKEERKANAANDDDDDEDETPTAAR